MATPQSWSIIIFGYNEGATLESVCTAVVEMFLSRNRSLFEVIIVDDGSTDNSHAVIVKLKEKYPDHVKAILNPTNFGIGRTLRAGYENARNENVCAVPADGQFDVNELVPHLDFGAHTIVSFYRKENLHYTSFRNVLSLFNKKVNEWFLGIRMRDVNWVKAYKTSEIKSFEWKVTSSLIESELCAKLIVKGNTVTEVVSQYHPRRAGESKGASLKIVIQALRETLKLVFILRNFRKSTKS